jgi:integrase
VDRGLEDPTSSIGLKRVRAGITRTVGIAPRRQAHPITVNELRRMLATCDDGVRGVRDRALLLVGFAGALRRSEIAAIRAEHITRQRDGIALALPRSKADQDGRGVVVGIARGQHAETDPITAVHSWLTLVGITSGPVFCAITRHNSIPRSVRPLSGAAVDCIIQARAVVAGLGDLSVSGHSLRAGHATAAAEAGVDASRIARTTRHERLETLQRYVRPAEALRDTTSRELGL